MTALTPLASVLHQDIWPFVGRATRERCETIAAENRMMNEQVPIIAPLLLETPLPILAAIWGVHPDEAQQRRRQIAGALARAERGEL